MQESPFERRHPDEATDERATLTQRLDFLRASAVRKAVGLTDVQAFHRPVPASDLTIEETARHCGHLDLLRESIDGATGQ